MYRAVMILISWRERESGGAHVLMSRMGRQMQRGRQAGIADIDLSASLKEQLNGTKVRRLDGQM